MHKKKVCVLQIALMGQFCLLDEELKTIPLDTASHQALFAYLALHPGQTHTRQHLAFTFWPDSSEGQARTNLRKALFYLRQALPHADTFLHTDRHTVMWRQELPYKLDVDTFTTAVFQAKQATSSRAQKQHLTLAENSYRGELLPELLTDYPALLPPEPISESWQRQQASVYGAGSRHSPSAAANFVIS